MFLLQHLYYCWLGETQEEQLGAEIQAEFAESAVILTWFKPVQFKRVINSS